MKKAVYIKATLYHQLYKGRKNRYTFKKIHLLKCRKSNLLPCSLGITFKVYNGRDYLKITVSKKIIGHKIGEFSGSRRRYFFKKGKVKSKRRK